MALMACVCGYPESRHSFGLNISARMIAMEWLANPRDEAIGGSNRCISGVRDDDVAFRLIAVYRLNEFNDW